MGWTAKVKDSVSYAAMTTLSDALAYRILWQMDAPATCEILLNDDSGGNTQTYGSAYMGTSAVLLEQPTATEIFRGRIISAVPNVQSNTLTLHGEDWLGQLDGRLVNYDTREILDPNEGNSMREYQLRPYLNDGSRCNAVTELAGDGSITLATDDTGNMAVDAYNGMKIIFPYSYMGKQVDYCYTYDETVTANAGAMNTDTPAAGEANTWANDGNVHQMSQTEAAADCGFKVAYSFKSLAYDNLAGNVKDQGGAGCGDGEFFTNMKIHLNLKVYGADVTDWYVKVTQAAGAWIIYHQESGLPMSDFQQHTITVPFPMNNVPDANGAFDVELFIVGPGAGGTTSLDVEYLMVETEYEVDTVLTTHAFTIDDTINLAGTYNQLDCDGDTLVTDGLLDWWRFHISDKITAYVIALVAAYDELYALNTGDVVASTVYIGRHYHRMTPLDILRDLAKADGTNFWLDPWDGDSLDLQWGSTYALNGEPTWTDTSVLTWLKPVQQLSDVTNEWFVEGYTAGDYKATGSDTDAGSITDYGQRSQLESNPDIGSSADCEDYADALVERTHDLPFHVGAVLDGYSTAAAVGDVVNVNSTKLGLANQKYVVSRKEYNSQPAVTTFHLTPRQDALNIQRHLDRFAKDISGRITHLETRVERGRRYTDLWS
jgi:hypothetical protein